MTLGHLRVFVLALLLCLSGNAGQAPLAPKPKLYVVTAKWCPPCRIFGAVWCKRPEVREALQDAFDVRELDWDRPAEQAKAISLGALGPPTFIAVRGTRRLGISVGFVVPRDAKELETAITELMLDLSVEWPRARTEISGQPPANSQNSPPVVAPEPIREKPSVNASGPVIDQTARSGVERLALEVGEIRADVAKSRIETRQQLQESQESTRVEITKVSEQIRETIERTNVAPSPAKPPTVDLFPAEKPPVGAPIISPEISTGPTAGKWLSVLGWIGKTGLTIAAPEVALPLSAGMTAAGFALSMFRRRRAARAPAALGHQSNPITIRDPSTVRTETKFVVYESDIEGEAYKEAVRRVGNQHRESQPYVVDLLKQVDGVAQQLAHGRRVLRRPKTESTSESI